MFSAVMRKVKEIKQGSVKGVIENLGLSMERSGRLLGGGNF